MALSFKSEFRFKNLGFSHNNPDDLRTPMSACIHPGVLLAYRILMFMYTITLMVVSIIKNNDGRWIEFLTSWNYIIVIVYFFVASFVSLSYFCGSRRKPKRNAHVNMSPSRDTIVHEMHIQEIRADTSDKSLDELSKDRTTILQKVYWLLFAISFNLTSHTTTIYWGILHNYNKTLGFDLDTYLVIDRHGVNQLLVYIDFVLNATPVRALHVIYPFIFVSMYLIFNVTYWKLTGIVLYSVVNYGTRPGLAAGVVVGGLLTVLMCQFILYGFYRLKLAVAGPDNEETV